MSVNAKVNDLQAGPPAVQPGQSSPSAGPPAGVGPYPVWLEASLTFSKLFVLLVGLGVSGLSLAGEHPVWQAGLMGAAAVAVVGLLLWALNWFLSQKALEAALDKTKADGQANAVTGAVTSTTEMRA